MFNLFDNNSFTFFIKILAYDDFRNVSSSDVFRFNSIASV